MTNILKYNIFNHRNKFLTKQILVNLLIMLIMLVSMNFIDFRFKNNNSLHLPVNSCYLFKQGFERRLYKLGDKA